MLVHVQALKQSARCLLYVHLTNVEFGRKASCGRVGEWEQKVGS